MVKRSDSTKILDIKRIRLLTVTLSKLDIKSCQRKERDWSYNPSTYFNRQKDFIMYHGISLQDAKNLVERVYRYDKDGIFLSRRSKYY